MADSKARQKYAEVLQSQIRHPPTHSSQILAMGGENTLELLTQKPGSGLQAAGWTSQHPQNWLHQQEIHRITQLFHKVRFLIIAYQSLHQLLARGEAVMSVQHHEFATPETCSTARLREQIVPIAPSTVTQQKLCWLWARLLSSWLHYEGDSPPPRDGTTWFLPSFQHEASWQTKQVRVPAVALQASSCS